MPCHAPIQGWRKAGQSKNGGRGFVLSHGAAFADRPMAVPCGQCLGCKARHAMHWAIRCSHEARMHPYSSFVTLTYDEEHVPHVDDDIDKPYTLRPDDFVLFMKKLRNARHPGIKFLQAGEYGTYGRPHHHAILFGVNFPDMKKWTRRGEHTLYTSEELATLWPHGFSSIGNVTIQSANYVAQYTVKKLDRPHHLTAHPEYATMSRRPGIGAGFLKTFPDDIYPRDAVITEGGQKHKPPRYYDKILQKENPESFREIELNRVAKGALKPEESGSYRLYSKQECLKARIRERQRGL